MVCVPICFSLFSTCKEQILKNSNEMIRIKSTKEREGQTWLQIIFLMWTLYFDIKLLYNFVWNCRKMQVASGVKNLHYCALLMPLDDSRVLSLSITCFEFINNLSFFSLNANIVLFLFFLQRVQIITNCGGNIVWNIAICATILHIHQNL